MTRTPDDLSGHVERDLDAGIARWFPDSGRARVPAETRSIDHLGGRPPADGQVAVWFHEKQVPEAATRFDRLDVFLRSLPRYEAVRRGRLPAAGVRADFPALGQGGVVAPEVGLLTYLKD